MHIKIHRIIKNGNEKWILDNSYTKEHNTQEEFIIPVNSISLSKATITKNSTYGYIAPKIHYIATIPTPNLNPSNPSQYNTIDISKEEYERIEHALALNNKNELNIINNTSNNPINIKNAINDLQVNEE